MKKSISIKDFRFRVTGYGRYMVTYTSPVTGNIWMAETTNMPLIDNTKNADNPKICDLNRLKEFVKNN